MSFGLFLPDKDADWGAGEVPVGANLVFEEAIVGLLDILGQVGIEDEGGHLGVGHLGTVFYLDELALDGWGRVGLYQGQEDLVELRGGDFALAVDVGVLGTLECAEDVLLGDC